MGGARIASFSTQTPFWVPSRRSVPIPRKALPTVWLAVAVLAIAAVAAGGALSSRSAERIADLTPTERGQVTRVVDGDTIHVRIEGRDETVRLIGVDTPESGGRGGQVEWFAGEATAFVRELTQGRTVGLARDPVGDTRDGYGRALRYVFLPDGSMLNRRIVAGGYGHAYTRFPFRYLEEFRALEGEARRSGQGLWSMANTPRIQGAEAGNHVGRTVTVCGRVASTHFARSTNGQPTYLNLDRAYPSQTVALVIWGNDRGRFGEPEKRFADRDICATGKVDQVRGQLRIELRDPSQLENPAANGDR